MLRKLDRLNKVIGVLQSKNTESVKGLSKIIGVSENTIRRDLSILAKEDWVEIFHGGARYKKDTIRDANITKYSILNAQIKKKDEKKRIGIKAASMINQDDVIIIDTGSTTEYIVKSILSDLSLTIICFSLNILTQIKLSPQVKIVFAGGELHQNTLMFQSPEGVELIKNRRANKAFISAAGVDKKLGVTCANLYEVETKKAILSSSALKILVADSSKFGKIESSYFADLNAFDMIITDNQIPKEFVILIRELDIDLVLV